MRMFQGRNLVPPCMLMILSITGVATRNCLNDTCFTLYQEPLTFAEAAANCSSSQMQGGGGGSLAVVKSLETKQFLDDLLKAEVDNSVVWWIGGNETDLGVFLWADDTVFGNFSNWESGGAESPATKRCIEIEYQSLMWTSQVCGADLGYICEKASSSAADCSTSDDAQEDVFVPLTSFCYTILHQLHTVVGWHTADTRCRESHQGQLATVNSQEISDALTAGLERVKDTVKVNGFWIGLHSGQWKWLDGTNIQTYYWMPGQPVDVDRCLAMKYREEPDAYLWSPDACDTSHAFICQTVTITTTEPLTTTSATTSNIVITSMTSIDPPTSTVAIATEMTTETTSTGDAQTTSLMTTSLTIFTTEPTNQASTTSMAGTTEVPTPTSFGTTTVLKATTVDAKETTATTPKITTHGLTTEELTTEEVITTPPESTTEDITTTATKTMPDESTPDITTEDIVIATPDKTTSEIPTDITTQADIITTDGDDDVTTITPQAISTESETAISVTQSQPIIETTTVNLPTTETVLTTVDSTTTGENPTEEGGTAGTLTSSSSLPSSTSEGRSPTEAGTLTAAEPESLPVYAIVLIVVLCVVTMVVIILCVVCLRNKQPEPFSNSTLPKSAAATQSVPYAGQAVNAYVATSIAPGLIVRNGPQTSSMYLPHKLTPVAGGKPWHWSQMPIEKGIRAGGDNKGITMTNNGGTVFVAKDDDEGFKSFESEHLGHREILSAAEEQSRKNHSSTTTASIHASLSSGDFSRTLLSNNAKKEEVDEEVQSSVAGYSSLANTLSGDLAWPSGGSPTPRTETTLLKESLTGTPRQEVISSPMPLPPSRLPHPLTGDDLLDELYSKIVPKSRRHLSQVAATGTAPGGGGDGGGGEESFTAASQNSRMSLVKGEAIEPTVTDECKFKTSIILK